MFRNTRIKTTLAAVLAGMFVLLLGGAAPIEAEGWLADAFATAGQLKDAASVILRHGTGR